MKSIAQPAISIVIPVLDEAENLRRCLQRLQAARSLGHEVIVVDGGSRDASHTLASTLADQVLVTGAGRARQMNAGASHARGAVLLFLHVDTELPANALQQLQQGLAAGGHWGRFDVRLSGRHPLFPVIARMMNWRSRLTGINTGDQAIFVRRSLFLALGGYPDLPLMEDVALSRRLKQHSRPVCLRATVITSSRRWQQRGVMRTILLMWWLRLAYVLGVSPRQLHRWYYRRPAGEAVAWTYPQARVLLFARAPQSGQVKTRLQPVLGAEGTLDVYRQLLWLVWTRVQSAGLCPLQLCAAGDARHEFFQRLPGLTLPVVEQRGSDLGERMQRAAAQALQQCDMVLLIGSDCLSLDAAYLRQALDALQSGVDVVLGPAEDGGYVLLGLRRSDLPIFANMPWGSAQVSEITTARLQQANVSWQCLDERWDVDTPDDLQRAGIGASPCR